MEIALFSSACSSMMEKKLTSLTLQDTPDLRYLRADLSRHQAQKVCAAREMLPWGILFARRSQSPGC